MRIINLYKTLLLNNKKKFKWILTRTLNSNRIKMKIYMKKKK